MTTETLTPRTSPLAARIEVPGSKSVSNRALVCAALSAGQSVIVGAADGDDTLRMLAALQMLGARVEKDGSRVTLHGPIDMSSTTSVVLDTGLAGTTSRFLTAVAGLRAGATTITGGEGLRRRPMGELHRLLGDLGADVRAERDGFLPVTIRGITNRKPGVTSVYAKGDTSSQFISAVMMVAPLLGGLEIGIDGPVVSREYLHMTAHVMSDFGAAVNIGEVVDTVSDENDNAMAGSRTVVRVGAGQYTATTFRVDADWSSASYPLAAAAIVGGVVLVPALRADSAQPEAGFVSVLTAMGCSVKHVNDSNFVGVEVSRTDTPLRGGKFDMSTMSDLVPTLAAIAVCATTTTEIRGVGFIRAKESDRIGDLARELRKCGAEVTELNDGLRIEPRSLQAATIDPHDDHRLAMALALLGLRQPGVVVGDADVVGKSWPRYWQAMKAL
ncbi:MAG: 3-phosphoshikimate 1-carboxyvinyltransferase [Actinomycetota bacterium]